MITRLASTIAQLSLRERWLLAACVLVILPIGLAQLVALPLQEAHGQARNALQDARLLGAWTQARHDEALELMDQQTAGGSTTPVPPIGTSGLEQSLSQAGLRNTLTRLADREGNVVELRFEQVEFTALTTWLDEVQDSWGYGIRSYRFEKTDIPGIVTVDFALRPSL